SHCAFMLMNPGCLTLKETVTLGASRVSYPEGISCGMPEQPGARSIQFRTFALALDRRVLPNETRGGIDFLLLVDGPSSSKHRSKACAEASHENIAARSSAVAAKPLRFSGEFRKSRIVIAMEPTSVGSK